MTKKFLTIVQVKSAIRRTQDQVDTLRGLGLTRLHNPRQIEDNPSVRGMIAKVAHLIQVTE
jgi:large subunit ribosomal protein L30